MQLTRVIRDAQQIERALDRIRTREPGAIMFVDLVGSTEFKVSHPLEEEWLPRLAKFLFGVSEIMGQAGRVVKYIGDEVMGFFSGQDACQNAQHASDQVLSFCRHLKSAKYEVKIALDFGEVSMLDFDTPASRDKHPGMGEGGDPQGIIVDRCARIMSKAIPGSVLCSREFRDATGSKRRWRAAGSFRPKGIPAVVSVFQLLADSAPWVRVRDEAMSLEECKARLIKAQHQLEEAKALRRPSPRRVR